MGSTRDDLGKILTTQHGMALKVDVESVHVPKTAGTAFVTVLRQWFGPALSVWYRGDLEDPITEATRIIHGHFRAGQHDAGFRMIWLRDPIDRLISDYHHKVRNPPGPEVDQIYIDVFEGRMNFMDFARDQSSRNYATQWYMGGLDLADFDFVGVSEFMNAEIFRLAELLGKKPVLLGRNININDNSGYVDFKNELSSGELSELLELNSMDAELYSRAFAESRRLSAERWLKT